MVSGLLLAGGRSKRFRKDKRFLILRGVPLVRGAHDLLKEVTQEVLVLVRDE